MYAGSECQSDTPTRGVSRRRLVRPSLARPTNSTTSARLHGAPRATKLPGDASYSYVVLSVETIRVYLAWTGAGRPV